MAAEKFGDYVLYELLGRGGMGEVHRAYDTTRKRTVALKRLPTALAKDDAFRRRFRVESEVAARLTEPHVLPVHDYGEIDGRLFLDMRYVQGPDLGNFLGRRGALPPEEAVSVVEQVAAALDAAHVDDLVHRDVKPSNVLITLSDEDTPSFAYLTDFGVAQIGGADTGLSTTNATAGTLDYMAPERYLSRRADPLVDVYSLGCVLYEVLTGRKPFPAGSLPEAMHAHLNQLPPRPSERVPGLSPAMDEVVARGMAKNASERFGSCGELAAAARAALTDTAGQPAPRSGHEVPALGEQPGGDPAADEAVPEAEAKRVVPTPRSGVTREGTVPDPSGPSGRRRGRTSLLVGATSVAAAIVVAVIAISGPEQVASPPPIGTSSEPVAASPAAVATAADGMFAGRSSGNEVTVALAVRDGKVAAYLCDGKSIESWFEGTSTGTTVELSNPSGSTVRANLSDEAALGTMTVKGRTLPFSAQRAPAPAGLYSARPGSSRIGWIVLPDGEQVGIRKDGNRVSPAPALDAATRTTMVDGQAVVATPVEPVPGAGW